MQGNYRLVLTALMTLVAALSVPNARADDRQDQLLMAEAGYGNLDKVTTLISQGANVNATNQYGHTALQRAVNNGHLRVIRLLIDKGANVNAKTRNGRSILAESAGNLASVDVMKVLLAAGAEPDPAALAMACWLNQTEKVKLLLDAKISPDAGLTRAAQAGHVEIVRLLLDKGARVNGPPNAETTPLHVAALQGGLPTVQLLIEKGANPNALDEEGDTPLHRAVSGDGNLEIVKLLVKAGAKMNVPNKEGITPVRFAGKYHMQGIYDWFLTANGGREPAPVAQTPADDKSTKTIDELFTALSSKDAGARVAAQQALAVRGKEIVPELMKRMEHGVNTEEYFDLLIALGPAAEAALPVLEKQLASDDQQRSVIAAYAVMQMRPSGFEGVNQASLKRAAAHLYDAITDPSADVMAGFGATLLGQMGEPAVPTVLRLLRHENPGLQAGMAKSLEVAPLANAEIRDELIKLLDKDQHPKVRYNAARGLTNPLYRSPQTKAALIACLRDAPAPKEAQTNAERAVQMEIYVWNSSIDTFEMYVPMALGVYGPEVIDDFYPLIRSKEGDPKWELYKRVWDYLGPDSVPRFKQLLDNDDDRIRKIAFEELGRLASESKESLDTLTTRMESPDRAEEMQAASALAAVPDQRKSLTPRFIAFAEDEKLDFWVRFGALQAALQLNAAETKSSDRIAAFISQVQKKAVDGEYLERVRCLDLLGKLGRAAQGVLPTLTQLADKPLPELSEAARARPVEPISEAVKKEKQAYFEAEYVRRAAKEAIEAIKKDTDGN